VLALYVLSICIRYLPLVSFVTLSISHFVDLDLQRVVCNEPYEKFVMKKIHVVDASKDWV